MPTDNIDRAIKKGTGELEGVTYEEITYEGYGPGGVAVLVQALTDNRNRTVAEIRNVFDKHGGNLGDVGQRRVDVHTSAGCIAVERAGVDEDQVMEVALEAGADDVARGGRPARGADRARALRDGEGRAREGGRHARPRPRSP